MDKCVNCGKFKDCIKYKYGFLCIGCYKSIKEFWNNWKLKKDIIK